MSSYNGRRDMTLLGISDLEVLAMIDDTADENGWTTTYNMRVQLGEDVESGQRTGVGSRLAWLCRYGWLERGERQQWRLTAMGHTLIENPTLSRSVENALGKLNAAQRMALTRELAEAGAHGPDEIRNALRRQWTRSLKGQR